MSAVLYAEEQVVGRMEPFVLHKRRWKHSKCFYYAVSKMEIKVLGTSVPSIFWWFFLRNSIRELSDRPSLDSTINVNIIRTQWPQFVKFNTNIMPPDVAWFGIFLTFR